MEAWELRAKRRDLTKRRVLAFLMAQYDPLGSLAPLLLGAKLLMRELYGASYKSDWDDPLPPAVQSRWVRLIEDALRMEQCQIPRSIVIEGFDEFWLVGFWDG